MKRSEKNNILNICLIILIMLICGCSKIQNKVIRQGIKIGNGNIIEEKAKQKKITEIIAGVIETKGYEIAELNTEKGIIKTEWKRIKIEDINLGGGVRIIGYSMEANNIKLVVGVRKEKYEILPLLKRSGTIETSFNEKQPYVKEIEEIVKQINEKIEEEGFYTWEVIEYTEKY